MILCLGTSPAVQRVMIFPRLNLDQVNRAATTIAGAAGKSVNVAKVLGALGESPFATGFLGGDSGAFIQSFLNKAGIPNEFVPVHSPTRTCVTVIDQAAPTVTELVEETRPVTPHETDQLLALLQSRIPSCRATIMSGTLAPGVPDSLYHDVVRVAESNGKLSVVDAKGAPLELSLAARPGVVKPNRQELAATVGRELADDGAVEDAVRELAERGAQRVVVTAGARPILAFEGKCFWRIQPPVIEAVNPIGSGDAFTAGLVWRLLRGDDLGEACRWGAAAGCANALHLMAGEVAPADVERLAGEATVDGPFP